MSVKIVPRRSEERGHADHGWLHTFHTFSFASYADWSHDQYGCLRVINEDRVEANTGFGTHPHREFEIFSYVVDGELAHHDSMGNKEVLKRGDVQMTSAGTGIRHSEHAHGPKQVHFLQIWALPYQRGLQPKYYNRHFTDAEKTNKLATIVAPVNSPGVIDSREAPGPTPIHAQLYMHASLVSPQTTLTHALPKPASTSSPAKAYIHVIQKSGYNTGPAKGGRVKVSGAGEEGVVLGEGDGAYIAGETRAELRIENVGDRVCEIVLFDVDAA
ncbi:RmlC-like cupin [Gloeophyllum trabeum ATCC 11539]|uniref:RmlC-like cupin n=1 Tax=Gloeophyllum trabeum (strain ATCC 11539 / FP-39264 / Madison 617) TaxID=670483 RepID=S7RTT0_GLOTA|nr:RmlC-like cupin [Gloeophyllum trabeum ATCC 11539]EPQ56554.1 RmlC-like cupin [Gloeophyllum trabeum ATCC 11539]